MNPTITWCRNNFVRECVHEVLRLLLCPSFDFIKNRFKSKPKLKPESSGQPEEYSKDNVNYDQPEESIIEGSDKSDLTLDQNDRSDSQRVAGLTGKAISIEEAKNRLRWIEKQRTTELIEQLTPIRDSAQASLRSIVDLAADLQNEEIKVEVERFESDTLLNTILNAIM